MPQPTAQRYAANTTVEVGKSQDDILRNLAKLGVPARDVAFARRAGVEGAVQFAWQGRVYRFKPSVPGADDPAICRDGRGRLRTADQIRAAQEQEERRVWRVLERLTRILPELVELDCLSPESLLLAYQVLANGETVGAHLASLFCNGSLLALPAPRE